jgi:hypothetical protein
VTLLRTYSRPQPDCLPDRRDWLRLIENWLEREIYLGATGSVWPERELVETASIVAAISRLMAA